MIAASCYSEEPQIERKHIQVRRSLRSWLIGGVNKVRDGGWMDFFFAFLHYIYHTRPDPITKRISAVPPSKWRDVSYICLPIDLLAFLLTAEEGRGEIVETGRYTKKNYSGEDCLASFFFNLWPKAGIETNLDMT